MQRIEMWPGAYRACILLEGFTQAWLEQAPEEAKKQEADAVAPSGTEELAFKIWIPVKGNILAIVSELKRRCLIYQWIYQWKLAHQAVTPRRTGATIGDLIMFLRKAKSSGMRLKEIRSCRPRPDTPSSGGSSRS